MSRELDERDEQQDSEFSTRAEEVFHRVASAQPEERGALLDEVCGGNRELRVLVESLIAAEREGDLFFRRVEADLAEGVGRLFEGRTERTSFFAAGERLGEFVLVREIGRGGMGVVWEATQTSIGRRVALKVLPPERVLARRSIERFRREAEAAGRVDHPGIVTVHAIGSDRGTHFIVQEYVEGGRTLTDRLGEVRRLSELPKEHDRETARLFIAVSDALEAAHQVGVVHRDVKPTNILLTAEGRPKLADFGLARLEGAPGISLSTEFVGTPAYMSPEQARGEREVDAQSDVFSLGATLYEATTLRRAFDGDTRHAILERIQSEEPIHPRNVRRRVPQALAAIVLKALEKNRSRRYASAAAFGADLRAFLEHRPVSARRVTAVGRIVRWAEREPAKALLASALLVGFPALALLAGKLVLDQPRVALARESERRALVEAHVLQGYLAMGSRFAEVLEDPSQMTGLGIPDTDSLIRSVGLFDRALDLEPSSIEALAGKCLCLMHLGRVQEVLDSLEEHAELLDVHPALAQIQIDALRVAGRAEEAEKIESTLRVPQAGIDYLILGTRLLERSVTGTEDTFTESFDLLQAAINASPSPSPLYLFQLARAAARGGDERSCRLLADVLVQRWPEDAHAWLARGTVLGTLDPEKACESLRTAIERGDRSGQAHQKLGVTLEGLGQRAAAIQALREAVVLDAEHFSAWRLLGLLSAKDGDRAAAFDAWQRASAVAPNARAFNELGNAFNNFEFFAEAIEAYREAVRLDADLFLAWNGLGSVLVKLGRLDEAEIALQRATSSPTYTAPWHNLAGASLLRRDYQTAIERYRKAAEMGLGLSMNNLAWLLVSTETPEALRDPEEGLRWAKEAVRVSERHDAAALDTLAEAYFANEDYEMAVATEQEALQALDAFPKPDSPIRADIERSLARFENAWDGH